MPQPKQYQPCLSGMIWRERCDWLNFKDVNLIGYLNNPTGTYLSREIDHEWTEYTLTRTFAAKNAAADSSENKVRYKAEFTGNNLIYPRIHSLGATLS